MDFYSSYQLKLILKAFYNLKMIKHLSRIMCVFEGVINHVQMRLNRVIGEHASVLFWLDMRSN